MSRPRFRRHFLWDTVQPRFLGLSLLYVVVVIAAVSGALFLPLMLQLDHLPLSSVEAQRVADQFELLHSRFWPAVAVVSLLLIVHGVFFTHRIASQARSIASAEFSTPWQAGISPCVPRFARATICTPKPSVWRKWSARCGKRSDESRRTMPTWLRSWSD